MSIRRKVTFLSRSSVIHRNHRMQFYETKMASEYLKQGWQVEILTTSFSNSQSNVVKEMHDSVEYVSFPSCEPDRYTSEYFTSTRKWIQHKDNESDLIIGSSWAGLGLLDMKDKNVCHVLHNSYSTNKKTRHLRKIVPQYIEWFINTRKIVKSNQKIIAVSNELRDMILKDYPFNIEVYSIPNGISVPDPIKNAKKRDPSRAIFIGRLNTQKGVEQIIEAARNIKDMKFAIHGTPQSEEYRLKLMNSIEGLENIEINCEGLLPEEVWSEYSGATYSLHPTVVNEGLPYSLLEAMGVGCIPVASMSGGMKTVIEDGESGYLFENTGSLDSLTKTLRKVIQNGEATRNYMSSKATSTVTEKFSAEKHIKSINKLMLG